jgi:hypothetical protein
VSSFERMKLGKCIVVYENFWQYTTQTYGKASFGPKFWLMLELIESICVRTFNEFFEYTNKIFKTFGSGCELLRISQNVFLLQKKKLSNFAEHRNTLILDFQNNTYSRDLLKITSFFFKHRSGLFFLLFFSCLVSPKKIILRIVTLF